VVSLPRSSNRTCPFRASGFPTDLTNQLAEAARDAHREAVTQFPLRPLPQIRRFSFLKPDRHPIIPPPILSRVISGVSLFTDPTGPCNNTQPHRADQPTHAVEHPEPAQAARKRKAKSSKTTFFIDPPQSYPSRSETILGGNAARNAFKTARTSMTSWLTAPLTGLK
jgi:hypothetical protein